MVFQVDNSKPIDRKFILAHWCGSKNVCPIHVYSYICYLCIKGGEYMNTHEINGLIAKTLTKINHQCLKESKFDSKSIKTINNM